MFVALAIVVTGFSACQGHFVIMLIYTHCDLKSYLVKLPPLTENTFSRGWGCFVSIEY